MAKNTNGSNLPPKGPEFKPGDKPYTSFGKIMLNANVPWDELVYQLLTVGKTKQEIAEYAGCQLNIIDEILKENFEGLCFRAGARIVTLHYSEYPMSSREFFE